MYFFVECLKRLKQYGLFYQLTCFGFSFCNASDAISTILFCSASKCFESTSHCSIAIPLQYSMQQDHIVNVVGQIIALQATVK